MTATPPHRCLIRVARREGVFTLTEDSTGEGRSSNVFPAGVVAEIQKQLRHQPPRPAEIESAISVCEDALMAILRRLGSPCMLVTGDSGFRRIAEAAGRSGSDPATLDLDAVERLFNALADVSEGIPAAQRGIPEDRDFAVHLVWLREIMHHGGFREVKIIAPAKE